MISVTGVCRWLWGVTSTAERCILVMWPWGPGVHIVAGSLGDAIAVDMVAVLTRGESLHRAYEPYLLLGAALSRERNKGDAHQIGTSVGLGVRLYPFGFRRLFFEAGMRSIVPGVGRSASVGIGYTFSLER